MQKIIKDLANSLILIMSYRHKQCTLLQYYYRYDSMVPYCKIISILQNELAKRISHSGKMHMQNKVCHHSCDNKCT